MNGNPLISIVIVSYQVKEQVIDCIRSVYDSYKDQFEIILVDNASSDGTADAVRANFPDVVLMAERINHGFSPGNNLGMAASRGKYIFLLNPDTIIFPGVIERLIEFHKGMNAGIVGPRLLNPDKSLQVSAWKFPRWVDSFLELFYLHRLFKRSNYSPSVFNENNEVDFVSGAAMLFERKLYEKIGGLDPSMFWMEDTDYCYRTILNGDKVYLCQEAEIIHIGGQSSSKNYKRMISNQLISKLKFSKKHYGGVHHFFLSMIIWMHIISRIFIFHIVYVFNRDQRAVAYRHSLKRLVRYQFKNDMSI
jgi:N-acetylglucosaminyl-diphospho-decaprenol L-rhamnosyltransferase